MVDRGFLAVGKKSYAEGGLRSSAPYPETFLGWGHTREIHGFPAGFARILPALRLSERPAGQRFRRAAFARLSAMVLRPWQL